MKKLIDWHIRNNELRLDQINIEEGYHQKYTDGRGLVHHEWQRLFTRRSVCFNLVTNDSR